MNSESGWLDKAVPEPRIVDDALWDRVKARQAALDAAATPAADSSTFQSKQRPKGLLAQLIRCGWCGGEYCKIGATHVGCSNDRIKGEAVCTNRRTIKLADLETGCSRPCARG